MTEESQQANDPLGLASLDMPEDTPEDEPEVETAPATTPTPPAQSVDWEKRYKDLQSHSTKRQQEDVAARRAAEDRVLALQAQLANPQPASDPTDPLAGERRTLEQTRQQLLAEREWERARQAHPSEVVAAYDEFTRTYALNPTPAGAITAYLSSIQALARASEAAGQQPAEQEPEPTPSKPRVDTSRSESPDPAAIERRIAGAKERKDPLAYVRAAMGLSERRSDS